MEKSDSELEGEHVKVLNQSLLTSPPACICNEDVRTALKSLGLEDFQVIDIDRSIPQMTCCSVEFRTRDFYRIFFTKELVINEVTARMKTSPPIASTVVDGDSTGGQDDYPKIPALSRMRIPQPPKTKNRMRIPEPPKTKKKNAKKQKNNHKQNKSCTNSDVATVKRPSEGIRKKRPGEAKKQKNNHKQNKSCTNSDVATVKRPSEGIRKKRPGEQKQSALEMLVEQKRFALEMLIAKSLEKTQNGKIQSA